MKTTNLLTADQSELLLSVLKTRFEKNNKRHQGIEWNQVLTKLKNKPAKLWSLNEMERTGGEPDVIGYNPQTNEYMFVDCAAESPAGRRSLCYDREGLESRKENRPENSVIDLADEMGIELLTEDQYRQLQQFGKFDAKTSSWIKTPEAIRKHGGALFADFRYDHVFVYHNGAQSYYAARGFRGALIV